MAIPIGSCPICIATRINCGETPNISAASAGFMLFSLNLSRLSMYFPPSAFLPGLGLATVVGCITGLGIFPYQVARVNDSFSFLYFSVPALFTV
ncbi:hypothetical protein [Mediterraneibacter gnavus]|uniref:hypothetical protein n=1 Tax=Mediterraneibacter gnavus TaxID=33038 RepID=UPI0015F33BAF|nr:hypothetical protein [Mediterraneibacter gnavus]